MTIIVFKKGLNVLAKTLLLPVSKDSEIVNGAISYEYYLLLKRNYIKDFYNLFLSKNTTFLGSNQAINYCSIHKKYFGTAKLRPKLFWKRPEMATETKENDPKALRVVSKMAETKTTRFGRIFLQFCVSL